MGNSEPVRARKVLIDRPCRGYCQIRNFNFAVVITEAGEPLADESV